VLAWADRLALPDAEAALALDRLQEVLPALVICFVGDHTYAVRPTAAGRGEALELFDPDGSGRLVGRALPLLSTIAMAIHGPKVTAWSRLFMPSSCAHSIASGRGSPRSGATPLAPARSR
jgi:hypothetical protein